MTLIRSATVAALAIIFFVGCALSLAVDLEGSEPHYVKTPGGFVWSECLWHMNHGSHVIESEDGSTTVIDPSGESMTLPKCEMPTKKTLEPKGNAKRAVKPDDGWQVWTTFQNSETFTSFIGYFTVPEAPLKWSAFAGEGILYLFTGLQSDNWVPIANEPSAPPTFDIIQPVLQFGGGSTNGGGRYWGIASWYVTLNNGALYSDLVKVSPNDNIFGNMTMTGPQTWVINSTDVNNGQSTYITVTRPRLASQPWAYNTMETYNIATCEYFPPSGSSIQFTELALYDANGEVTPTWETNQNTNHCTATLTISDPADVTISF